MKIIERLLQAIRDFAKWVTVALLSWMVLLAMVRLITRWLGVESFGWADQHLRYVLLWLALSGGVLASSGGRHLQIDLVSHYLEPRSRVIIEGLIGALAGMLSVYLAYVSLLFLQSERSGGGVTFGMPFGLALPTWYFEASLPVGLALMGFAFFLRTILNFSNTAVHQSSTPTP
jgi:TRAP-type C4-dicarboxylate transport system permease small subunit